VRPGDTVPSTPTPFTTLPPGRTFPLAGVRSPWDTHLWDTHPWDMAEPGPSDARAGVGRPLPGTRPPQVSRSGAYASSAIPNVQATPAFAVRVDGGTRSQ
jgi:hypothetical protein